MANEAARRKNLLYTSAVDSEVSMIFPANDARKRARGRKENDGKEKGALGATAEDI